MSHSKARATQFRVEKKNQLNFWPNEFRNDVVKLLKRGVKKSVLSKELNITTRTLESWGKREPFGSVKQKSEGTPSSWKKEFHELKIREKGTKISFVREQELAPMRRDGIEVYGFNFEQLKGLLFSKRE